LTETPTPLPTFTPESTAEITGTPIGGFPPLSGEGIVGGGIDLNANARSAAFDPTQYLSFVQRFDNEPAASDEVIAPYTYAGLPTSTVMTFPYLSVSTIQTGQFQNLSVQLDLELGADPAITYNVTNYAFRHFFSRIGYGSQVHQVSIMLKDINGESLFYSACEFTSSSSNPACVLDSFQQAISGVRTVTIIHKLKSGITTSSNYAEYLLGLDDIRITTDQIVIPPPTPTPTLTPTPPPPSDVEIEFNVLTDQPVIPFRDEVPVRLTISNNSGLDIEDGELLIQGFTTFSTPNYATYSIPIVPLRLVAVEGVQGTCCNEDNGETRLRLFGINIPIDSTVEYQLVLQPRRSGLIEVDYTFQSTSLGESVNGMAEVMHVAVTRLDLQETDQLLKVPIFWATFFETSEGSMVAYPASGSCILDADGWLTGTDESTGIGLPVGIIRVVTFPDASIPGCRAIEYMDAQVMLNGILNYERSPQADHPFYYFSSNYRKSLGNNPFCNIGTEPDQIAEVDAERLCGFYIGSGGTEANPDPNYGSYTFWMQNPNTLWPTAIDIGLDGINQVSYQ